MVGYAMDRGCIKDSKNTLNSFFSKISRTGFWRFGTDMGAKGMETKEKVFKNTPKNSKKDNQF